MTSRISVSAPGKVILLGEHSVVFGRPAIALAINKRFNCSLAPASEYYLNGISLEPSRHPHIRHALKHYWEGGPLDIRLHSELPSGSGLGSSAALSVAFVGSLQAMSGNIIENKVAKAAFEMEYAAQGRASPVDTSVSTHGGGIIITREEGLNHLWTFEKAEKRWCVHDLQVPTMTLVVGYTGINGPTGPLLTKVKNYYDKSGFARETIDDMENITLEGQNALHKGDLEHLGRLMTRNHKMLSILGVSCNELNKLVNAAMPYSYGAKLTGAGGGGSMIALTDRPDEVCNAILRRGGTPYKVLTGVAGVKVE